MLDELPALIAAGYEEVPEEDFVRLKWWGLYHDKPKIGTFMLRIKLPAGRADGRAAARRSASCRIGTAKGSGELRRARRSSSTTSSSPRCRRCSAARRRSGLTTAGACGDAVRNITGCPVAGIAADELFDATPVVDEVDALLLRQPRLLRPAAQAQDHDRGLRAPVQRARDQLHLARRRRCTTASPASRCSSAAGCRPCRGSRATSASSSRVDEALPRAARAARRVEGGPALPGLARQGAAQVHGRRPRRRGHARRGRAPPRLRAAGLRARPARRRITDHIGVHAAEAARASSRSASRCTSGSSRATRWSRSPSSRRGVGGDVRVTRQQNFVLTGVPERRRRRAWRAARGARPARSTATRSARESIACTGEPHCNFAVAETKTRLGDAVDDLEAASASRSPACSCNLDGCPHACGQHWVGDLGFQGTTVRERRGRAPAGVRHLPARRARARRGDRAAGVPPRAGRGARPMPSRASSTAGSSSAATSRGLPRVLRPASATRSSALSPGASRRRSRRGGGGGMSEELLDELEAGELAVEFEGAEPRGAPRVGARALRRRGSRSRPPSRSTAWP